MTITKTLTIESNGRQIVFEVERTKKVTDNISYSDGWNINLGKQTIDSTYIRIIIDGVCKVSTSTAPHVITEQAYRGSYKSLIAKGVYGRVGDAYLTEVNYNKLMDLIVEAEAELETTEEFAAVKAKEDAEEAAKIAKAEKEVEHYHKMLDAGMCPKCGTWCYGDCEAN
jgi:hypothetical protein